MKDNEKPRLISQKEMKRRSVTGKAPTKRTSKNIPRCQVWVHLKSGLGVEAIDIIGMHLNYIIDNTIDLL